MGKTSWDLTFNRPTSDWDRCSYIQSKRLGLTTGVLRGEEYSRQCVVLPSLLLHTYRNGVELLPVGGYPQ